MELSRFLFFLDFFPAFFFVCAEDSHTSFLSSCGIVLEWVEEEKDFFLLGGTWDRPCSEAGLKFFGPCDFFLFGAPRVGDRDLVLLVGLMTERSWRSDLLPSPVRLRDEADFFRGFFSSLGTIRPCADADLKDWLPLIRREGEDRIR